MTTGLTPIFTFAESPASLPAGYAAAPLTEEQARAALRLCVVVKKDAKDGAPFVFLRETLDARVFLGCITDTGGRVQRWVEIWVQETSGLSKAPAAYREAMTNGVLDARWAARCDWFDKVSSAAGSGFGAGPLIRTGWEAEHPPLLFIDAVRAMPVAPKDRRNGASWALCRDDAFLAKKGAVAYGASGDRMLHQPELGDQSDLEPAGVAGASNGESLGLGKEAAGLNPSGGLMMVQPLSQLSYEQFVDAVGGGAAGADTGDAVMRSIAAAAGLKGPAGWLMLGGSGLRGRVLEAFHLKVMALAGAVALVRSAAESSQTPFLNITDRSFRVRIGEGLGMFPLWWASRPALVEPAESVELPLPGTKAKYFVPGRGWSQPMYAPAAAGRALQGRGTLRLRNVLADGSGAIIEATLSAQERLTPGTNDLVWLRFTIQGARVDAYATVDLSRALAAGEMAVRTIPHKLSADVVEKLKASLAVPIPDAMFDLVPLISTPADLYSLGVLGVRTLLVNPGTTLPKAVDDLLSLAAECAKEAESGADLVSRIASAFASDARWAGALGPGRLVNEEIEAGAAFSIIPAELWFRTLAALIRAFTGLTVDARCRDLGDAPAGGAHKVFDELLESLHAILVGGRSLIVSDQGASSEIRAVVASCLAGLNK